MEPQTFIADSAADAIAKIRAQLGPDAVVLSVKQLPASGLGRLFQRGKIEVVACIPEKPEPQVDPLSEIKQQLAELRQQLEQRTPKGERLNVIVPASPIEPEAIPGVVRPPPVGRTQPLPGVSQESLSASAGLRGPAQILEKIGILPLYIQKVLEVIEQTQPEPPRTVAREVEVVCSTLKRLWRSRTDPGANVHVFIGPPGTGKTTCLCKWLAKSVLLENRRARVWRLDGVGPNAAESLSVYAEILGVPVERFRSPEEQIDPAELLLIDLPGVNLKDTAGMEALAQQLGDFPAGQVHLVLNAAYEVPVLLQQARAFSRYMIFDMILTHLDEEPRWSKLWNLVLGTNYSLGWMSAGQNIPGEFHPASAQALFDRQFSSK